MKIKDEHFRKLYRKPVIIKSKRNAEIHDKLMDIGHYDFDSIESIDDLKLKREVNAILAMPYIDHEAGFSFYFITTALIKDHKITIYNNKNPDIMSNIRKDSVDSDEFIYLDEIDIDSDFDYDYHLKYAQDLISHYTTKELEELRMLDLIDESRNADYPDDILVFFFKKNMKTEGMWVRCESLKDGYIEGKLLNTPENLEITQGSLVKVYLHREDNRIICFNNLDEK